MIQSIHIKNVATFDDEKGVEIEDLNKINFIYGANGTGKTTITKFLYGPTHPNYNDCTLTWHQDTPTRILVYNKDFKERNFGKGSLNGIFTIGQATKEELEKIETLKAELQALAIEGKSKKETLDTLFLSKDGHENHFKEEVWTSIYKKYEGAFKEAFKGVSHKKELFKERLILEFNHNAKPLFTYSELEKNAKIIFGDAPQTISFLPQLDYSEIIEIESNTICQKKIIGKSDVDIAALIQRLNINDWVNEGRRYLQEGNRCPFCQNETITTAFRTQLEQYFDETFINDNRLILTITEEYNRLATNLIDELNNIEEMERAKVESLLNVDLLSSLIKTITSQFATNKELLHSKCRELSRSIELTSVKEQLLLIQRIIDDTNIEISKHNRIVSDYSHQKSNLISSIWKYIIEENKLKIKSFIEKQNYYQKGIDSINKEITDLRVQYSRLDTEIKSLSKNVTDTQHSIDEINRLLKSYGFTNFEIVKSKIEKHKYQIQRADETIAESTLSEGEITFITFLYFLQKAKGSETSDAVNEERILVIDDPISNLDSTILFVVSSLIKDLIKDIRTDIGQIRQLIVLTHNIYFYKEVSIINGRIKTLSDTSFWMLRKQKNCSSIQNFGKENPIHSSYELLWNEIRNKENVSSKNLQNTMRQIIENYFRVIGKYGDDDIVLKFSEDIEQKICRSLLCWINDGSDSIHDDLFIELNETTIEKYKEVFRNIFDKSGQIEHYQMMMRDI